MKAKIIGKLWHVSTIVGVLLLASLSNGVAQSPDDDSWEILFNGKDLSGWRQLNGKHRWEVRDGMIVGTTVADQPNGFLCTEDEYSDFVLELEVSIDTLMNNSGVQFRNRSYPAYQNGRVHGYQMEVDPKPQQWSGAIYEEGGDRHWLYSGFLLTQAAKDAFKLDNVDGYQWNKYRIECVGARIRTWINGVPAAHLIDDRFPRGFIGLQLHANQANDPEGDYQVRFRNIRIKRADFTPAPLDDIYVVNYLPNQLSAQEEKNGVVLLWDGHSAGKWRKASGETLDQRQEGKHAAGCLAGQQDTCVFRFDTPITMDLPYTAFELTFDFKYDEHGEGGLIYLADSQSVVEDGSNALQYHIRHDGDGASLDTTRSLGALYGLLPSTKHWWFTKKPNHWNQAVVRVFPDRRVEHWLNGYLVLEYDLDSLSDQLTDGTTIALRSGVAYRSLKVRKLN
ncbi:3-keto-disaccharide hydrolase [Parapedobacter luteus]|nr:DUF1080 domain-containing protein [Parapedobacter luteus]